VEDLAVAEVLPEVGNITKSLGFQYITSGASSRNFARRDIYPCARRDIYPFFIFMFSKMIILEGNEQEEGINIPSGGGFK
jgi:hypothetical protein